MSMGYYQIRGFSLLQRAGVFCSKPARCLVLLTVVAFQGLAPLPCIASVPVQSQCLSHSLLFAAASFQAWFGVTACLDNHPYCWGTRSQDNPHTHYLSSPTLSLVIGTAVSERKLALVFTVYSFFLSSYSFFYTSFPISFSCYSFAALLPSLNFRALTKAATLFTPHTGLQQTARHQTPCHIREAPVSTLVNRYHCQMVYILHQYKSQVTEPY